MSISCLGVVGSDDGAGSAAAVALTDDVPAGSLLLCGLTWSGYGGPASNPDATLPFSWTDSQSNPHASLGTSGGGTGTKVTGSSYIDACVVTNPLSIGDEVSWVFRQRTTPFPLTSAAWAAILLAFDGEWGNVNTGSPEKVWEFTPDGILLPNNTPYHVDENTHSGRDVTMARNPGTAYSQALLVAALTHIGSPSDIGALPAGWILPAGGQASRAGVTNTATVEGGTRTIDMAYRIVTAGDYPINVSPLYAGANRYHTHQAMSFVEILPPDVQGISPGLLEAVGTPGHIIIGPSGASL